MATRRGKRFMIPSRKEEAMCNDPTLERRISALKVRVRELEAELSDTKRYLETYRRMNDKTREALDCEDKGTVESIEELKAELAAHLENEGDECPLCVCEAESQRLREALGHLKNKVCDYCSELWMDDALKEVDDGPRQEV